MFLLSLPVSIPIFCGSLPMFDAIDMVKSVKSLSFDTEIPHETMDDKSLALFSPPAR